MSVRLNLPVVDPILTIREQLKAAGGNDPSIEIVELWPVESAAGSLWDLLAAVEIWKGTDLQEFVLVFDQFEELFTLDWSAEARRHFIADLGDVLRGYRPAVPGDPTGEAPTLKATARQIRPRDPRGLARCS